VKLDRGTLRGFGGVLAALLIIAGIHFIKPGVSSAPDFPCGIESRETVTVDVHSGETGSSIGFDMAALGVVKSSAAFFRIAVSDTRAGSIAPGSHLLSKNLCAKDALDQLLDPKRITNLLTVPEGAWSSEIKISLSKIGFTSQEISRGFQETRIPSGFQSLEGLLFPAQYSFDTSTPVSAILQKMVDRGLSEVNRAGLTTAQEKFTSAQLLTIASLVQAEGDPKDYAKIAQVVRNRLTKGMPLQFDSTIHYIKGSRGSVFLSTQSTFLKSPYNTYRNYGLPPTQINNPGYEAMYAAAHPEAGNWIYFITVAPGDTRFTDSLDQFYTWKALYKKNLRAGLFRSSK
jgi:UPF0755 protein